MFYQILSVVLLASAALAVPPPSYINVCHFKDPNFKACALKNANRALPEIVKGDKKFNIPSMNPLKVPSVTLKQAGFELNLKDLSIYGFPESKITEIDYTGDKIKLTFHLPNVQIIGQYSANGKLSIIPLKGSGACNISATDGDFTVTTSLSTTSVKGVEHLKFLDTVMDYKVKRAYFNLENLLKDDNLKIDANQLLNDNWKDVLEDLGVAFKETVTVVYKQIISNLFEKVSKKDLFPD